MTQFIIRLTFYSPERQAPIGVVYRPLREIIEKSTFPQDFWISAAGGVIHFETVWQKSVIHYTRSFTFNY